MTTVLSDLDRYRLAITAIQEVRWTGTGHLKTEKYTVFYSGGTKHERGVGFIVNDQVLQNVKKFEAINDRICFLEIQCKWFKIILINCYGPTEDKDENQKSEFYENIERINNRLSNNYIKMMLGDFNSKIRKEPTLKWTIRKESLHDTSNDNGEGLINLALASKIIISSTCFPRKNIHKEIWVSSNEMVRNQIDHVLIDAKRRRYIMDVRSHRGVSGNSDHFFSEDQNQNKISS